MAYDFTFTWEHVSSEYDYYPETENIIWRTTGQMLTENEADFIVTHGTISTSEAFHGSPVTLSKNENKKIIGERRFRVIATVLPWYPGKHSLTLTLNSDSFTTPEVEVKRPILQLLDHYGEGIWEDYGFLVPSNGAQEKIDVALSYPISDKSPDSFPDSITITGGYSSEDGIDMEVTRTDNNWSTYDAEWQPWSGGTPTHIKTTMGVRTLSFNGMDFDPAHKYASEYEHNDIYARVTYPHGFTLSVGIWADIDNPLYGCNDFPSTPYEYEVHKGRTAQGEYVSVANVDTSDSNVYTVENMLTWPKRKFTVDLSRGGSLDMNWITKQYDVWNENGKICKRSDGSFYASIAGEMGIIEDISDKEQYDICGPRYIGRRVIHSVSGEDISKVHSIIHEFSHYSVFAVFDAKEMHNRVEAKNYWETPWSYSFDSGFLSFKTMGLFQAGIKYNYPEKFASIIDEYNYDAINLGLDFDGFSVKTNTPIHVEYETKTHDVFGNEVTNETYNVSLYSPYDMLNNASFCATHPSEYLQALQKAVGYNILYDAVYVHGADTENGGLCWRNIAANCQPDFKINSLPRLFVSRYFWGNYEVYEVNTGEYSVIQCVESPVEPVFEKINSNLVGYRRIHLFWADKTFIKYSVNSKALNPKTSYNANLTLVNGWYDPSLYESGVPVLANNVGMYFFPDNESSNLRGGYPAYYPNEKPFIMKKVDGGYRRMEDNLSIGDLANRDLNAAR